jgi:hypothetical protein
MSQAFLDLLDVDILPRFADRTAGSGTNESRALKTQAP